MRYRLIELLACPKCGPESPILKCKATQSEKEGVKTDFTKRVCSQWCSFRKQKASEIKPLGKKASAKAREGFPCNRCFSEEITTGTLHCKSCGEVYPITRGIPRMLTKELRKEDAQWENYSKRYAYVCQGIERKPTPFPGGTVTEFVCHPSVAILMYAHGQ